MGLKKLILLVFLSFLAMSCQRAQQESAFIKIKIPTKSEFFASSKVSSMALQVNYDLLCFMVNAKASDIPITSEPCAIEKGISQGFVPPGSTLTLEIPAGTGRSIEIYGYQRSSLNEACPSVNGALQIAKTYFLGRTSGVDIVPPEMTVAVSISLPTTDQNVSIQQQWASSCQMGPPAGARGTGFRVGVVPDQSSSTLKVYSRIVDKPEGMVQVGSTLKVSGSIKGR